MAVCLLDCEQNKLFRQQNQTKTFQMVDRHFRLYVSIYEINNTWEFGDMATPLRINSISPSAHLLFSIYKIMCIVRGL